MIPVYRCEMDSGYKEESSEPLRGNMEQRDSCYYVGKRIVIWTDNTDFDRLFHGGMFVFLSVMYSPCIVYSITVFRRQ